MEENQPSGSGPIELRDLLSLVWRGRLFVGFAVLICAVIACVFALRLPDVYRSQAQLKAPNAEAQRIGGTQPLAALGALTGLDFQGNGNGVEVATAVLQSRDFLVRFVRSHNATVPLFAGKEWDLRRGRLLLDPDVYDPASRKWTRDAAPASTAAPTDEEIYRKFRQVLDVERDPQSGFVTMSVTFISPVLAQRWSSWLIQDLNARLRAQQIMRLNRSIVYLRGQLAVSTITSMSQALQQLLLSQLRDRMLAAGSDEFALEVIDPPNRPVFKDGPNRALIVLAGAVLGGVVGVLLVLCVPALRLSSVKRSGSDVRRSAVS